MELETLTLWWGGLPQFLILAHPGRAPSFFLFGPGGSALGTPTALLLRRGLSVTILLGCFVRVWRGFLVHFLVSGVSLTWMKLLLAMGVSEYARNSLTVRVQSTQRVWFLRVAFLLGLLTWACRYLAPPPQKKKRPTFPLTPLAPPHPPPQS